MVLVLAPYTYSLTIFTLLLVLPLLIQDYLDYLDLCDSVLTFDRFMSNSYISLRELEEQCKVNLRFMYLIFSLSVLIFSLIARHLYKIDHTVSTNNITSWSCIYFLFTYWTIILYRFII